MVVGGLWLVDFSSRVSPICLNQDLKDSKERQVSETISRIPENINS